MFWLRSVRVGSTCRGWGLRCHVEATRTERNFFQLRSAQRWLSASFISARQTWFNATAPFIYLIISTRWDNAPILNQAKTSLGAEKNKPKRPGFRVLAIKIHGLRMDHGQPPKSVHFASLATHHVDEMNNPFSPDCGRARANEGMVLGIIVIVVSTRVIMF